MHRALLTSWLAIFAVAACNGTPKVEAPVGCPSLVPWTQQEANVLADEIDEFGWQAPYMARAVGEYRTLRRQCEPPKED